MKRLLALALAVLTALSVTSCSKQSKTTVFAMDTVMTLEVFGDFPLDFLDECSQIIFELEKKLSVTDQSSALAKINKNGGGELDEGSAKLVKRALELSELTDGAFDISIRELVELWGFTEDTPRVPKDEAIRDALSRLGSDRIKLSGNRVELSECEIDLGGIAKGYLSKMLYEYANECGVGSAVINLGGNVRLVGNKGGEPWKVGLRAPNVASGIFATVSIDGDKAVITSGGYQRFFEEDGVTYHHIIDPKSGYPADSGLLSVTVISDDDVLADAFSTAIFVGGEALAKKLYTECGGFEYVLVDTNNAVSCSVGIAESVHLTNDDYHFNKS